MLGQFRCVCPVIALEKHIQKSHDVISKYSLVNQQTNQIIPVPLIELNFVELPKFTKSIEECTTEVDQWLYLMKNAETCYEIPEEMKKNEVFLEAFSALEQKNWSTEELRKYVEEQEAVGKGDRIREGDEEYAEEYALERAAKAREEGARKEKEFVAINFLKMGLSSEIIAQGTSLSIKEIDALHKKLKKI